MTSCLWFVVTPEHKRKMETEAPQEDETGGP